MERHKRRTMINGKISVKRMLYVSLFKTVSLLRGGCVLPLAPICVMALDDAAL
jgi:hypothetical protein